MRENNGFLAQLRVVQVEEVLVEVKVGVAFPFPDAVPMDGSDDADEEVEGDLEVHGDVVGQELQRLAHEGVAVAESLSDLVKTDPGQVDVLRPGEEQSERNGLRVPVREHVISSCREQQRPPVACKAQERLGLFSLSGLDGAAFGVELVEDFTS